MMLCGETEVGKTCLQIGFAREAFSTYRRTSPTMAPDFMARIINLDSQKIKLYLWDISGKERFKQMSEAYMAFCHAFLLVFDTTDEDSFRQIGDKWLPSIKCQMAMKRIRERCGQIRLNAVLVGNKSDLHDQRQVTYDTAKTYADSIGIPYIETSAKTGENVEMAVIHAAALLMKNKAIS